MTKQTKAILKTSQTVGLIMFHSLV